ncbi:MAG: hypothetical protein ACOYNN_11110, partial [Terrimicrobiaceae bacterium]
MKNLVAGPQLTSLLGQTPARNPVDKLRALEILNSRANKSSAVGPGAAIFDELPHAPGETRRTPESSTICQFVSVGLKCRKHSSKT